MRTHDILGIEAEFIEPSFHALPDESYTGIILTLPGQEARILVDPDDWPLALAVKDGDKWSAGSFLLRPPVVEVVERFDQLGGDVVRTTAEEWMLAMREYYSLAILHGTPMASRGPFPGPHCQAGGPRRLGVERAAGSRMPGLRLRLGNGLPWFCSGRASFRLPMITMPA